MKEKLNYKRISAVLLILVILLIIPHFCNNTDKYDVLKKQLSEQKELVNKVEQKRIKEKDSLLSKITARELENKNQEKEISDLNNRIKNLKNKPISVPKDLNGLVMYFNDRYKTNLNKLVDNKVGLVEEVAYDVSYELEEADIAIETVSLQDKVIKKQDTIISNLNKDKVDLSLIISSAENEIKERKKLQEMSDENIKSLEKQVRKQKNKNIWNKILLGVGTMTSFYIGTQIGR